MVKIHLIKGVKWNGIGEPFEGTIIEGLSAQNVIDDGARRIYVTSGAEVLLTVDAEDLVGLDLRHSRLGFTDLTSFSLRGTNLSHCCLFGARLRGVDLSDSHICHSDLQGADLRAASLRNADLRGTHLGLALLQAAELTGADLSDARLPYAKYDLATKWPDGFDPIARRAKLVDST